MSIFGSTQSSIRKDVKGMEGYLWAAKGTVKLETILFDEIFPLSGLYAGINFFDIRNGHKTSIAPHVVPL